MVGIYVRNIDRAKNDSGRLHYLSGQKVCQSCDLFIKRIKNRCRLVVISNSDCLQELPKISTGSCRASIRHISIHFFKKMTKKSHHMCESNIYTIHQVQKQDSDSQ